MKKSSLPLRVETPTNVVDLMAALRKSLDAVSTGKKPAAKADLKKKVTAKAEPAKKKKVG